MSVAIYPGSFDPITNGHLDIIIRLSKIYDEVIVAVLNNSAKSPLFTTDERVELIEKCIKGLDNVHTETFDGLLVDFARLKNVTTIVKGLRAISDFEYEFQMALLNKKLSPDIETLFMISSENHMYISSSIVKEIAKFGGALTGLVPDEIVNDLKLKIEKRG
ncbi:MAG: pantetheine-phosphate adenylyltransferase [Ruminococcaceae bacterium]|nr:pantetheine-phosphate adenylyltransferase [Oscillospiraceae bacterium]